MEKPVDGAVGGGEMVTPKGAGWGGAGVWKTWTRVLSTVPTVCHILRGPRSEGLWGSRSQHHDEELLCNLLWCLLSLLPPFCTLLTRDLL